MAGESGGIPPLGGSCSFVVCAQHRRVSPSRAGWGEDENFCHQTRPAGWPQVMLAHAYPPLGTHRMGPDISRQSQQKCHRSVDSPCCSLSSAACDVRRSPCSCRGRSHSVGMVWLASITMSLSFCWVTSWVRITLKPAEFSMSSNSSSLWDPLLFLSTTTHDSGLLL